MANQLAIRTVCESGDEIIAHKDRGFVVPEQVRGGAAPAAFAFIDHVIMQQRGGVDEFDRGGQFHMMRALIAAHPRGGQGQHRAQTFSPGLDQMGRHLGDAGRVFAVGGGSLWLGTTNAGLYRFNLTTNTFTHHPFTGITNAAPVEDVLFQDIRTIWFSMPTNYAIGAFNSTRGTYNTTATIARVVDPNDGSTQAILLEPNGLALDPSGQQLWIAGNNPSINGGFGAVGRLITQTWTDLVWYFAPPGSGPYGVVIVNTPNGTETWVTHTTAGNAGRFQFNTNGLLINSETTPRAAAARFFGITQAPDSHIWIADSGRNILVELAPPYIYKLYAALIAN
jgi:streptogramin lyase